MISMYTKQEIIIRSYREGQSQRSISSELQISRKTVKKYIEEYEKVIQGGSCSRECQSVYLSTEPVYKMGFRTKLKLTQEVAGAIDSLLETNRQKKQQGLRKQLLKKKDILEELCTPQSFRVERQVYRYRAGTAMAFKRA